MWDLRVGMQVKRVWMADGCVGMKEWAGRGRLICMFIFVWGGPGIGDDNRASPASHP